MELFKLLRIANRVADTVGARNKGLLNDFKKKYKNVPDYVLHEVYNGFGDDKVGASETLEGELKSFNDMEWKLQKVDLHWDKMSPITQNNFKRRKFGIKNPDGVWNDAERLKRQIESLAGKGKNEPMIFIETERGLELYEGFHRTMALLLKGSENLEKTIKELTDADENEIGSIAKKWKSIPAEAWVGKEKPGKEDEEIDMGGDWQS